MAEENVYQINELHAHIDTTNYKETAPIRDEEIFEIMQYPEDKGDEEMDEEENVIETLVQNTLREREKIENRSPHLAAGEKPVGYVSNARNAVSRSDEFQFWAPAEEDAPGIGHIVRHTTTMPQLIHTYGIIVDTEGSTLGLDDYATHVYEQDAQPPLESIQPAPSARRPLVNYHVKVLASTSTIQRPVMSGPVYAITTSELAEIHGKSSELWLDPAYLLTGFYEDIKGEFGIFAEERARVLGPKQGHIVFSGLPGAGKTSLFLTLIISLYAQLQQLEDNEKEQQPKTPRTATLAINVKGADLLFLDHLDHEELAVHDHKMWQTAQVDVYKTPFKRVFFYVPLDDDGYNRNSLRSNPAADIAGYSETREFSLGIQDLWPYLDLFFDKRTTSMSILLAEIENYFMEEQSDGFTLSDVLRLFTEQIKKPKGERADRWSEFHMSTIQSVYQRFRSLPSTLNGLIDVTGRGSGLKELVDLQPHDMIVIDIERIMANPSDPEIAANAIKIITAYILKKLTEGMTKRLYNVDHIIVFADELNHLAPRNGDKGIGEYLSQLARTTRDRGIVLFGAGQFRSGINEDILKAASVHYSLQTPEHELNDRIYSQLSPEVKARLTRLRPGEALIQYPSLRTAVFARFPRPFVMSGATKWQENFPPLMKRALAECIAERLRQLDPQKAPRQEDVQQLLNDIFAAGIEQKQPSKAVEQEIIKVLRDIEVDHQHNHNRNSLPWQQFSNLIHAKYKQPQQTYTNISYEPTPASFIEKEDKW